MKDQQPKDNSVQSFAERDVDRRPLGRDKGPHFVPTRPHRATSKAKARSQSESDLRQRALFQASDEPPHSDSATVLDGESDARGNFEDLLIRASAGTGKTFQLSNRYLQLIFTGWRADRILATTFTRKAAGEIIDRVLLRIAKAAESQAGVEQLAMEIELPLTLSQCREKLRELTTQLHRLRISTLDAFFLQAAQMLSLELGMPPGWDLADENGESAVQQQSLARLLDAGVKAHHSSGSRDNEDRQQTPKANAANEGTVNQADLIQLIHWLAHGETNRSVNAMLNDSIHGMYATFLDSVAAAWKKLGKYQQVDSDAAVRAITTLENWEPSDEKSSSLRLKKALQKIAGLAAQNKWADVVGETLVANVRIGKLTYYRQELPDDVVGSLECLGDCSFAEMRNRYILQTEASYELLVRFHEHCEATKHARRLFSFSDLPRYLAEGVEAAEVKRLDFRLDAGIDALLLDEFQDTSRAQWQVIRQLALPGPIDVQVSAANAARPPKSEVPAEAEVASKVEAEKTSDTTVKSAPHSTGNAKSFLCVGDTKQAIYGWRGGDAALLDAIEHEVPSVTSVDLNQSYRSSSVVIDLVNRVNESLISHPALGRAEAAAREWCDRFPKHSTARDLPGYVSLETSRFAEKAGPGRDRCFEAAAKRIALIRQTTPGLSIAVLVRKNACVASVIYALQSLGIDASEESGSPLTDSAAVQLVMSLLHLADFPQDSAAFFHLQQSPWAVELGLLNSNEQNAQRTTSTTSVAEKLASSVHTELLDNGYGSTVSKWCDQLNSFSNLREQRRLAQLVDLAYQYERSVESPRTIGQLRQNRVTLRTTGFLQRIEKHRFSDPSEDPVRVMTVHQSKGLQFDVVILPDLANPLVGQTPVCVAQRTDPTQPLAAVSRYIKGRALDGFPRQIQTMHAQYQDERVREELCVLYVALTRAIHSVQMFVAPNVDPEVPEEESPDNDGSDRSKKNTGRSATPEKLDSTFAGAIRHALVGEIPLLPEQCVYEAGDAAWMFPQGRTNELSAATPAQPATQVKAVEESGAGGSSPPRIVMLATSDAKCNESRIVRPSSLEGGGSVQLRDRLAQRNQSAMRRGTLIHAFFEQVQWLDVSIPSDEDLETAGLALGAARSEVESAIAEFRGMLQLPKIAELLSRDAYRDWPKSVETGRLDVRNEQRVSVQSSEGRLSGSIDRLVLRFSNASDREGRPIAADVIDFKTDRVTDDTELLRLVEHYRPQLDAYRRGLANMLRLESSQITTRLVMLGAGVIKEVS